MLLALSLTGLVSFYSSSLQGLPTASGTRFDNYKLTAAHKTLPFGTQVLIENPKNKRCVVVVITDRGPYHKARVLDLSQAAFKHLSPLSTGVLQVRYRVLK